jgi:hypothetical protein
VAELGRRAGVADRRACSRVPHPRDPRGIGVNERESERPGTYALDRQGPQIWVAPTADDSDGWIARMRAIAIESGAFVVAVPQFIPRAAFPEDFPVDLPDL